MRALAAYLLATFLALSPIAAQAETRLAMVIGNSGYTDPMPPLPNATNDAESMIEVLKDSNFEIFEGGLHDLKQKEMVEALDRFAKRAGTVDVVLLYYAGHAISLEGVSYLIPSDMDISKITEGDTASYAQTLLMNHSVTLSSIINAMGDARTKIIILDACRDNPIIKAIAAGQISGTSNRFYHDPIAPSPGVAIIYSTGDQQAASDGTDKNKNGPFVTSFKKYYTIPGLNIFNLVGKINDDVALTNPSIKTGQFAQLVTQPRGNTFAFKGQELIKDNSEIEKLLEIYLRAKIAAQTGGQTSPTSLTPPSAPPMQDTLGSIGPEQARTMANEERDAGLKAEAERDPANTARHFAKARRLYAIAAATGNPVDETNYATMLLNGLGGPFDAGKSAELLADAAQKGQIEAQFMLGRLAFEQNNDVDAERWLSKVVDCHSIDEPNRAEKIRAAYYLGVILAKRPEDFRQGRYCLNRAADLNYEPARRWLQDHHR